MTATDSQAIRLLADMLKTFIDENRVQHTEIKDSIKGIGGHVEDIENHCYEREQEVNAILARRQVMFDAEIAAAKLEAVAEATRPSVYALATRGALEGFVRFATRAAVVIGLLSGFIALLKLIRLF